MNCASPASDNSGLRPLRRLPGSRPVPEFLPVYGCERAEVVRSITDLGSAQANNTPPLLVSTY